MQAMELQMYETLPINLQQYQCEMNISGIKLMINTYPVLNGQDLLD